MNIRKKLQILALTAVISFSSVVQVKADLWKHFKVDLDRNNLIKLGITASTTALATFFALYYYEKFEKKKKKEIKRKIRRQIAMDEERKNREAVDRENANMNKEELTDLNEIG